MRDARDRGGRERMPLTIVGALALAALFVVVIAGFGVYALSSILLTSPAAADMTPVGFGVIAAGIVLNIAIFLGLRRRTDWSRWLVVLQALVLIVTLTATVSVWAVPGILAVAVQTVLVVVPQSRTWFTDPPATRRA